MPKTENKHKNDTSLIIFANRLRDERIRHKLKQKDACMQFSLFAGRDSILPVSTMSSWETAAKRPNTYQELVALADFYGVSTDYLLGRSEERKNGELKSKERLFLDDFIVKIDEKDLALYDNKPIYITYSDGLRTYGEWAIYDKKKDVLRLSDNDIKHMSHYNYYACTPDSFPQPRRRIR